jgi:hypothetical protein
VSDSAQPSSEAEPGLGDGHGGRSQAQPGLAAQRTLEAQKLQEVQQVLEGQMALAREYCTELDVKAKSQGSWRTISETLHYVLGLTALGLSLGR